MKEKYVLWFRNGLETTSYHAPQLWTIFLEELKQRNTTSLFKSDMKQQICNECPCRLCKVFVPNLGFIWGTAPNLVLNIHHRLFNARVCVCMYVCVCVYICIYTSRLAGRYMFNCEYVGICCYLTCISQHLAILSISIFSFYWVFFVVDVN